MRFCVLVCAGDAAVLHLGPVERGGGHSTSPPAVPGWAGGTPAGQLCAATQHREAGEWGLLQQLACLMM
jgi:hypothetical protein